ncbi:sodium-dependent phosphate transport protein 2C-like isoform X2 [Zophobas morio]|uniref:sodium-dependent phosphate transport protein 2C-like isoform X2 n=1 Tax=Zophobas morio TaxID=2755281 RepID=UPI003082AF4D
MKKEEFEDKWKIKWTDSRSPVPKFKSMTLHQKLFFISLILARTLGITGSLYFFMISLDLLGSAFQLLSVTAFGKLLKNSEEFKNPVACLVFGLIFTALVHSSSTTSSVFVSLAASKIFKVKQIIFMIMGANIGTSLTGVIVSMTQISDKQMFRRAFAAATIHDMFNFLTVLILFPLELFSGLLEKMAAGSTASISDKQGVNWNFIKHITEPLTNRIIQVDKEAFLSTVNQNAMETGIINRSACSTPNKFLFCSDALSSTAIGFILLFCSLALVMTCLLLLVKILQSIMKGTVSRSIYKVISQDFPYPFGWAKDYALIGVGLILTLFVQSSSITTSALVSLAGVGLLTINSVLPVCVGANLGTTFTSILSAFSQRNVKTALTVAFTHFYFNFLGFLIWFLVPYMRRVPTTVSKKFGNITAEHRWFSVFYVMTAFLLVPFALLGLSFAGMGALVGVVVPIVTVLLALLIVLRIRKKKPEWLPPFLLEFYWLPIWMRREPSFLKKFHLWLEERALKKKSRRSGKLTFSERIFERLGPLNEEYTNQRSILTNKKSIEKTTPFDKAEFTIESV